MKLLLHIGLHKTGTSSIQGVWLDTFGNIKSNSPFFPKPSHKGPGHMAIAEKALGLNGVQQSYNEIGELLDFAKKSKVNIFLLSSEDFMKADPKQINNFCEFLKSEVETIDTIITITPFEKRIVSAYVEMVKNGHLGNLEYSLSELLIFNGIDTYHIESIIKEINYDRLLLLAYDSSEINHNLARQALSLYVNEIDIDCVPLTSVRTNISYDCFDTEFWRLVNMYRLDINNIASYYDAQSCIEACISSSLWNELRKHIPQLKIKLPMDWREQLKEKAILQRTYFESLTFDNRTSVKGDLAIIDKDCDVFSKHSFRDRLLYGYQD